MGEETTFSFRKEELFRMLNWFNYYVFVTTNSNGTRFTIDVTGDLIKKLNEIEHDTAVKPDTCIHLVYFESFMIPGHALKREREIKRMSKKRLVELVKAHNQDWRFLNEDIKIAGKIVTI